MKKLFTLFFSVLCLLSYSQKLTTVGELPTKSADLQINTKTINASNFKVVINKPNKRINFSFNLSGDYYRVQTTIYKNSIAPENRIAYGVREDEAWYEPIHYPEGFLYEDWNANPNESAYDSASKYILVLEVWENTNQGLTPTATATLTYTPPAPIKPNLFIKQFQVFDFMTGEKLFDSKAPTGNPLYFKYMNNYRFVVKFGKEGYVAVNNVDVGVFEYDRYWGEYPNVNTVNKEQKINFSESETEKDVTFNHSIGMLSGNKIGFAIHIDKYGKVSETNESDNLNILNALFTASKMAQSEINVDVYDMNGNLIKTLKTTFDDYDFNKIKSKLEKGKYILKSNTLSKQVLIQ